MDAYCIDVMTKHESHHSLNSHRLSTSAPLTAAIFGKLIYSITSYKVPTCSKLNLGRLQSLCTYNLFDCTEEKAHSTLIYLPTSRDTMLLSSDTESAETLISISSSLSKFPPLYISL